MKPSNFQLLSIISQKINAKRYVLYQNGTLVMMFDDDKQPLEDYLKMFKKINKLTDLLLQQSMAFDDFSGYYCFYDNYSSVCLLYVTEHESSLSDAKQKQLKKEMIVNFEKDLKSQVVVFDSDKEKITDYETAMYLFVNNSLSMGKGKIAGQVGHAVGKLVEKLTKKPTQEYVDWSQTLCKKIVLKATAEQMIELAKMEFAVAIHDAGRTQIAPNSLTVVGFPPKYLNNVPQTFTKYKLL